MAEKPIIIIPRSDGRDGVEIFIKDADIRGGEKVYKLTRALEEQAAWVLATARFNRGER